MKIPETILFIIRVIKPDGEAHANPSASVIPVIPNSRTFAFSNLCVAMPKSKDGHCVGSIKKQ